MCRDPLNETSVSRDVPDLVLIGRGEDFLGESPPLNETPLNKTLGVRGPESTTRYVPTMSHSGGGIFLGYLIFAQQVRIKIFSHPGQFAGPSIP